MTLTGDAIPVGDRPLTVDDVVRVADGARVELHPSAFERMRAGRAVVDELVAGDELIYGLNTGLGHLRDVRVPLDVLRAYQEAIVLAHEGAFGAPLPTRVVRAAMFVRIAGLARGEAGATPAVAETLVTMLDRGVHPIVPTIGSVGASDLMHMAAIGLVATGLGGRAEVGGEVLAGPDALRRVGLAPLEMAAKDGLALISSNGVSIGHAALVVDRARATARLADLVVAVSLEAIHGNPSVVEPAVLAAKPVAGQIESGARIRAFLGGGDRCRPGGPASVQDPLSFRVAPQVHGAFREFVRFLAEAVELELGASDDNPFVSVAERRLVSNGNFHPIVLALAADAVRPAAAHVGLLADRRLSHLWAATWRDGDLQSVDGLRAAADAGSPLLRYAAATRYTELRAAAGPVTLDVAPLDLGIEDHATNAPFAVRRTDDALDLLDDLLAVELLLARDVTRRDPEVGRSGHGVRAALDALAATIEDLGTRPPSDIVHRAVVVTLPSILAAAEGAIR